MSNQRKQIILNEITFWKQNKLLPEHYCDFLMTLYTEGEQEHASIGNAREAVKAKEKRKGQGWYFLVPLMAIALVAATFIVESLLFVAIPALLIALILVIVGIRILKKTELLSLVFHLSAALIILGVSLKFCLTYFAGDNIALYTTLIANCILWLIAGIGLRLVYFTIAGGLGIIAIFIYGGFQ